MPTNLTFVEFAQRERREVHVLHTAIGLCSAGVGGEPFSLSDGHLHSGLGVCGGVVGTAQGHAVELAQDLEASLASSVLREGLVDHQHVDDWCVEPLGHEAHTEFPTGERFDHREVVDEVGANDGGPGFGSFEQPCDDLNGSVDERDAFTFDSLVGDAVDIDGPLRNGSTGVDDLVDPSVHLDATLIGDEGERDGNVVVPIGSRGFQVEADEGPCTPRCLHDPMFAGGV